MSIAARATIDKLGRLQWVPPVPQYRAPRIRQKRRARSLKGQRTLFETDILSERDGEKNATGRFGPGGVDDVETKKDDIFGPDDDKPALVRCDERRVSRRSGIPNGGQSVLCEERASCCKEEE